MGVLFNEANESDGAVVLSDSPEPAQESKRTMMMIDSRATADFFISSNQVRMGNVTSSHIPEGAELLDS